VVDWTLEHTPTTEEAERVAEEKLKATGLRTWLLATYEIGRLHFAEGNTPPHHRLSLSAVKWARELGCWIWIGSEECFRSGRKKKVPIDVDEFVGKWHELIVGLAMAHDKDEADRFEAAVEECLNPILKCPVKQLRVFAGKLRDSLKADKRVPYLVWSALETWVDKVVLLAPDQGIIELKTQLAREIVEMVEDDARRDLPAAMVRALQWRSPEKLEEVKQVVAAEKEAGRPVRLKGRESCLFLEAGGTEDEPKVCVQV
jgi:hypothetical protein